MSKQIFSTLTTDQRYTIYQKSANKGEPAVVEKVNGKNVQILIKGGHGVAGEYFQTPEGVCTEVEDNVLEALLKCEMFERHKKRGFIKVYDKKADPAKVAKDMTPKDGGAPLVDSDFAANKAPVAGQPEQPGA